MCTNVHQDAKNPMSQDTPSAACWWFVYILECADGTFYTGCTTDVARRIHEHGFTSRGARYTRSRRPVVLRYQMRCKNRSEALKEEIRIKRLSRAEKILLLENTTCV